MGLVRPGRVLLATVGCLLAFAPMSAAGAADALVLTEAPAEWLTDTSGPALNGPIDIPALARSAGLAVPEGLDAMNLQGEARTWTDGTGKVAVVFAVKTASDADAAEFARGVVAGAGELDGAERYASTLSGIDGFSGSRAGVTVAGVAWSQGPVASLVLSAGAATGVPDAAGRFATLQSDYLKATYGTEVDQSSDQAPAGVSRAVVVLAVLGLALVVGTGLVLSRRRRRAPTAPWSVGVPVDPIGVGPTLPYGHGPLMPPPSAPAPPRGSGDPQNWDIYAPPAPRSS